MKMIIAAALAAFLVVPAFAQECVSIEREELLERFPPGEFRLVDEAPNFESKWQRDGSRTLIGSGSKYVEIQQRGAKFCVIEFDGDPRVLGERL